jgi:hypothetical protein
MGFDDMAVAVDDFGLFIAHGIFPSADLIATLFSAWLYLPFGTLRTNGDSRTDI